MRRLIAFGFLLMALPGIAFAQDSENQTAEQQRQKAIQSNKDTVVRFNAAVEYVYSQVVSWAPIFDACPHDTAESIDIEILYNCKGKIKLLTKTSDCIKKAIPKRFDIDITKDVCVCKEGRILFTYNKSDGIMIKQKTRIGIVNTSEYCHVYRFKRSRLYHDLKHER